MDDYRKNYLLVVLSLTILGLSSSIYLTVSHYNIVTGKELKGSFCTISELVDCDAVTASSYSDVFGIPWSAIGTIVFLLVLSICIFGYFVSHFSLVSLRIIFILALISVLFDVYLASIGFLVLRKICLVCSFTYVLNLTILYFSKRGCRERIREIIANLVVDLFTSREEEKDKIITKRLFFYHNGMIIVFCFTLIGVLRWHFMGGKEQIASQIVKSFRMQDPVEINTDGAPHLGDLRARIQIVEFSDFRCPYCKQYSAILNIVHKRYPRDVVLYFKHYPLDGNCNRYIGKTLHRDACKISRLAVCAQDAQLFWDLKGLFFSSDEYFLENLKKRLRLRGVNLKEFFRCASGGTSLQRLSHDIDDANRCGVDVIPTIFINGYRLVGAYEPITLSFVIEAFLSGRIRKEGLERAS